MGSAVKKKGKRNAGGTVNRKQKREWKDRRGIQCSFICRCAPSLEGLSPKASEARVLGEGSLVLFLCCSGLLGCISRMF